MTAVLSPVRFDAPLVNPASTGLFAATQWTSDAEPFRWLPSGVEIRPWNFRLSGFGVWAAAWDAVQSDLGPDDVKAPGVRPESLPVFAPITTFASDEGDPSPESQAEVLVRAQQIHRLQEPNAVGAVFAERMLDDVGTPDTADDLVGAVAQIEAQFADENTVGYIHASPMWAASAAQAMLLVRSNTGLKSPLGHTWVFDGGYRSALGETLVATSQPFGWRGEVVTRSGVDLELARFQAIVERSMVIGYEHAAGAVTVTG